MFPIYVEIPICFALVDNTVMCISLLTAAKIYVTENYNLLLLHIF